MKPERSKAWPEGTKWYPDDYTPIGGRWNPRWEEWKKEHPEAAKPLEDDNQ